MKTKNHLTIDCPIGLSLYSVVFPSVALVGWYGFVAQPSLLAIMHTLSLLFPFSFGKSL